MKVGGGLWAVTARRKIALEFWNIGLKQADKIVAIDLPPRERRI
jgi:hypothetical protein